MNFYPLIFEPIYKERIWGGTKLKDYLNKSFNENQIGESWELSSVEGDVSVISNGVFKGLSLNELINKYTVEILGSDSINKFGVNFPLLFKFLDAKEDLSIQVHPNDKLAKERHNSFGKTEMWYVVQAEENAKLIVGFKKNIDKNTYSKSLDSKNLTSILNEVNVKKGDVFFLETGTVHAIGAGTIIAEIQQTSDITYRLYDWERVDINGNERELHTELAIDAINYNKTNSIINYSKTNNFSNKIVHCNYFKTNILPVLNSYKWSKTKDSFTVFMCIEGNFTIDLNNEKFNYKAGDTVLIPAQIEHFQIVGNANLLEITI